MSARFALLAALLLTVLLSLGVTGGAGAAPSEHGVHERHLADGAPALSGARREARLKLPAEHRSAQFEDDDDDLDGKPDAMGHAQPAALPSRPIVATSVSRIACRLALARSAAFRARQRLDDAFPTGPPSILREGRPA